MDIAALARANRILDTLLQCPPEQRLGAAQTACAGDDELLQRVLRLLAHALLDDPTQDTPQSPLWREALGALSNRPLFEDGGSIGPYRLIRRLGHGGSAEVYLAERREPGVVQQVALKLALADAPDEVALARFQQEQQILARLNHPNIGKIFDVGRSTAGRPYFVMEYIDGEAIDQYCDRRALDLTQRLRLLRKVAGAVAHAHGELVVHRDIKPSNVLVDLRGEPRLLDFGIAKIIDGNTRTSELTLAGSAPATVGYASPEQLAGEPVGVASDVYQLGMLAYVLLAGQRPYATHGMSSGEVVSMLRQPQRLSPSDKLRQLLAGGEQDRVQTIATQRRMAVHALLRSLDRDLDEVVLKAISSRPGDRYESVAQFTDDLDNVLQGRPVKARPPSLRYSIASAVRRHRLLTASASLLLLGLVGFSATLASLAYRLDEARRRAERQSLLAEQVTDFIIDSFRSAGPDDGEGQEPLVKQALDRAANAPDTRFDDDPAYRARLHLVLGRAYESLHEHPAAEREYRRALHEARSLPPAERQPAEYQALNALGRSALRSGESSEALAQFDGVLELTQGDRGAAALRAAAQANRANALEQLGNRKAALQANAEAASNFERLYGPDHPQSIRILLARAQLLSGDNRYSEPEHLREALEIASDLAPRASRVLGRSDVTALITRLLLHRLQSQLGRHQAAAAGFATVLPEATAVLGGRDLHVLAARTDHGLSRMQLGERAAGIAELQRTVEALAERFNPRHPTLRYARFDLALALALDGQTTAAAMMLRDADLTFLQREPVLLDALARAPAATVEATPPTD